MDHDVTIIGRKLSPGMPRRCSSHAPAAPCSWVDTGSPRNRFAAAFARLSRAGRTEAVGHSGPVCAANSALIRQSFFRDDARGLDRSRR